MFDRFTDRARKVMGFARQEAQRFNQQYISTEHLLLGLVCERTGVAAQTLRNLHVTEDRLREEIARLVSDGPTMVTMGQLPFTPRMKRVMELASEEATKLRHNYIGTEHLLLGLIREPEGYAAIALRAVGLTDAIVRAEIMDLLHTPLDTSGDLGSPQTKSVAQTSSPCTAIDDHELFLAEASVIFDRYQQFTRTTAVFPGAGTTGFNSLAYLTFGLAGEAGESAEKMKKRYRLGGANAFLPGSVVVVDEKTGKEESFEEFRTALKKELSDCLWYVAALADHLGLPLSSVAQANVEKLQKRKVDGTLKGSGDNR